MRNRSTLLLLVGATLLSSCISTQAPTLSITLKNRHGQAISNATLTINGSSVKTDAKGKAVFSGLSGEENPLSFAELPKGYIAKDGVNVPKDGETEIVLDSTLIEGTAPRGSYLGIGDLAYDFSYTAYSIDANGNKSKTEKKLSDQLKTHDFIAVNFFYFTCSACKQEAPYVQAAASSYADSCYFLALDSTDNTKGDAEMYAFAQKESFTFDLAYDYSFITNSYGVSAVPSTIIIDRYGFICFYYSYSFLSTKEITDVFDRFKGEDYQPVFYKTGSLEIDE